MNRLSRIARALELNRLGQTLIHVDAIESTNTELKRRAALGAPEGYVIFADEQTAGRGRMGKSWVSLPGKGVYVSVLLRPKWATSESVYIAMMAGVAVARALERLGVTGVTLKWPNDVMVCGRKIAGILVEPRVIDQRIEFVVIGVGINIQHTGEDLTGLYDLPATSCRLEGLQTACDDVLIEVLNELDTAYVAALHGGCGRIIEEWSARKEPTP